MKKLYWGASERSAWWPFIFSTKSQLKNWIERFFSAQYNFSPLIQYSFKYDVVRCWSYQDRLFIKLIQGIVKPTFRHIISERCFHLQGPSGVKSAIHHCLNALGFKRFQYVIRVDIKHFYESISHPILLQQLKLHFQDPRLQRYFSQIVTIPIDKGGVLFTPTKGIPRRSSLSPFFGALYLSPLDQAFQQRPGVQYFRYMDDILILIETQRQYQRARRALFKVLNQLGLSLSPGKSKMGRMAQGFHFLGVQFDVPQSHQKQSQVRHRLHPRSCARALQKVRALQSHAVHPATSPHYLLGWGTWWATTLMHHSVLSLLNAWLLFTTDREPSAVWIARGLLAFNSSCQDPLT